MKDFLPSFPALHAHTHTLANGPGLPRKIPMPKRALAAGTNVDAIGRSGAAGGEKVGGSRSNSGKLRERRW
ncbi:hypothetical protein GWI33_001839 [Rhynchophorus ferrugineus]|uniref:Uncharacterized protein n=1 Tax=Rhynchophorus ferrugineus TaxID=354439 RepID=A0A834INK0_RHYFE|nr:hypothetical protein GWI33_001839 [Rhynchophorus ferrugineus]